MKFSKVLKETLWMLFTEKRVSYQRLRLEFDLDDKRLDALRREFIQVKRVAADQDGEFLVWAGSHEAATPTPSPRATTPPLAPVRESQAAAKPQTQAATEASAEVVALPVKAPAPDAERRQLTVMFCDLVGSTALSTRLDPEDLQELIRVYQQTCARVVERFDGYVARYLGDGVLVYFGYPQAHERDAERGLRTALAIVAAMGALNADQHRTPGAELAVRIGLATGVVVVGELIGEGASQERNVVGETPNLAARLQTLAQPNGIVIGSVTKDLAGEGFLFEDLGAHELNGITGRVKAWAVVGEREDDTDADERQQSIATRALVGRQEELGLLRRAWAQSQAGQGQVVLISGEPGIGKSRLVDAVGAELKTQGATRVTLRCSPYHTHSALYPVIQHLQRLLARRGGDGAGQQLAALEQVLVGREQLPDNGVALLASLLSLPLPAGRYRPLNLSPQQQKQQTLDVLVAWMNDEAERGPTLWVWEDLHWADPSTLELLGLEIEQCPTAPILNVLTFRPDFTPPWPARSHLTPLTLSHLERAEVEALIERHTAGKALPVEVVEHIVAKADGVPLYVEELTKVIVAGDFLRDAGGRYELTAPLSEVAIPATLQDSLMARLDRLPTVREVAQLGAVFGREFAYEMFAAVTALDEPALRESLERLVEEELLYQRGRPPRARYIFKHALIQDIAYQSLLKRTRQQYHRQVAELLETQFPHIVEAHPELLARHFTEADRVESAIRYWRQAGQQASERSAHQEALSHLQTGLELLKKQPATPQRHRQELALQTALGAVLLILKGLGSPEVEAAYTRAYELCQRLGDSQDVYPILFGLWRFCTGQPDLPRSRQLAEELLALAGERDEASHYVIAHHAFGYTYLCQGETHQAQYSFEQVMAHYPRARPDFPLFRAGQDPGVAARNYTAWTLWLLGYPDQARVRIDDALTFAAQLDHPFSSAFALLFAAIALQFQRDQQAVYQQAEAAMTLSAQHGFSYWQGHSTILYGWAMMAQGRHQEGLEQMHRGLNIYKRSASKGRTLRPYFLTLFADRYSELGRVEEGLNAASEALDSMPGSANFWWHAETWRFKGDLLLRQATPEAAAAEECYHQALNIARRQQARSLELRAAMSLARHWQTRDRRQDAYSLLFPLYDWFTEGFDTADLEGAKALLDELT